MMVGTEALKKKKKEEEEENEKMTNTKLVHLIYLWQII